MNTRVGKGFFEEKMANLKVFIGGMRKFAKYRRQHFIHESRKQLSSALKDVSSKMIFIGSYTCSRSINEKSHLCLAKYL